MKLEYIYKANQCSDVSDVDIALLQLKSLLTTKPYETKAMVKRRVSLEKRKQQLINKQKW